jgi:hypothetical protein
MYGVSEIKNKTQTFCEIPWYPLCLGGSIIFLSYKRCAGVFLIYGDPISMQKE